LVDGHVRPESARSGVHGRLGSDVSFTVEFLGAEEPHDDALLIDHDAGVPPSCSNSFPNIPEGVLETARRHIPARDRRRSLSAGSRAFGRKSSRYPVQLACGVIVDSAEPKALEPPRGPWAQVSSRVPAVDDDGSLG